MLRRTSSNTWLTKMLVTVTRRSEEATSEERETAKRNQREGIVLRTGMCCKPAISSPLPFAPSPLFPLFTPYLSPQVDHKRHGAGASEVRREDQVRSATNDPPSPAPPLFITLCSHVCVTE